MAACVGSIESPGTTSKGIPVTCATTRKITAAYAIGSARTNRRRGATRATDASCAVAATCIPAKLPRPLPAAGLLVSFPPCREICCRAPAWRWASESPRALPPNRSAVARFG